MAHAARAAKPLTVVLAALALIAALTLAAAQPRTASASPAHADAAKLKKCKKGLNAKRCKCPKGSQLTKKGRKYRCKKKPQPTNTNTNTQTNTTPPPPPPPPAGVQPQRDDTAFEAALTGTMLRRYEEGTYGYGRYAYNYLGDHQFLYCSYYSVNGSAPESNRAGTWQVVEGYTVPGYPGYTAGKVRITGSDFDVLMAVEMYNDRSNVATGNASNVFTQGAFGRYAGGAVTNCSAIE